MKALVLGSKILSFFMEFEDLLDSNLDLATLPLSFFWHSYAIVWEIGEICRTHFRQIFD